MVEDEKWMRRCLQLARCGEQGAAPNPMVGAVVVHDGKIIGEGFHACCGKSHAEVNAIAAVSHPEWLRESRLYVSLEPCAHYGRTPPCARLIIEKGIPEVVVGMVDPFCKVNGAGIRMLREAGVKVRTGVLEAECRSLNRKFIVSQLCGRPYVLLKWAQSADGFMAPELQPEGKVFVSSPYTQIGIHHLRTLNQAILVGRNTAMADNPSLTARRWYGNNPLRIVLDRNGVLPASLHLFDGRVPTLVVGEHDNEERCKSSNYTFLHVDYSRDVLPQILKHLKDSGIQSLLVEGGRQVLDSFLAAGMWDEAQVEIGRTCFHGGLQAPCLPQNATVRVSQNFGHTFLHYEHIDKLT